MTNTYQNVSDIKGFWNVFRKCDYDRIGIVATEDFFTKIVQEGRNMFGNAIFELIDAEDPDKVRQARLYPNGSRGL